MLTQEMVFTLNLDSDGDGFDLISGFEGKNCAITGDCFNLKYGFTTQLSTPEKSRLF